MSETNQKRLDAIRESHGRRKKRKREASLHIALTEAERAEFRQIADEHGMLDRELLVNAIRAFKTGAKRLDVVEARLMLLDARIAQLEQQPYRMPE